jgi:hypothetical protein
MGETLRFRNKTNGPLPIDLPGGNSISVAAKGYFTCTPEDAECPDVRRERAAGRIKLVGEKVDPKVTRVRTHVPPVKQREAVKRLIEKGREEKSHPRFIEDKPLPEFVPEASGKVEKGRPEEDEPLVIEDGKSDESSDSGEEKNNDSLTSSSEMMESEETPADDGTEKEPSGGKKSKKSKKRKKS